MMEDSHFNSYFWSPVQGQVRMQTGFRSTCACVHAPTLPHVSVQFCFNASCVWVCVSDWECCVSKQGEGAAGTTGQKPCLPTWLLPLPHHGSGGRCRGCGHGCSGQRAGAEAGTGASAPFLTQHHGGARTVHRNHDSWYSRYDCGCEKLSQCPVSLCCWVVLDTAQFFTWTTVSWWSLKK